MHSGLDYAGPILVRLGLGRGYKSYKAYVALFICLATRAIYLELVSDSTSTTFLAAFKRGLRSNLYSDNGTNFQGANKELKSAFRILRHDENLRHFFVEENIEWRFIPPYAPHFQGLWEAGDRNLKHHLHRVVGNHTLTIEEMLTFLCQVEASLNSRPISAISDNADSLSNLKPGHFLTGSHLLSIPEPSVLNVNENRLSRWELVQGLNELLWKRWSIEYFHGL